MKPQTPWFRVFVEGVVIVGSILLAFGIQAWWEGYQEHRQESEYLIALRGELLRAQTVKSDTREAADAILRAHESLIGQFRVNSLAAPDSLLFWLSLLSRPVLFDPPVAVLDDIVSSGGIQLIETDELRLAVADYQRQLRGFEREADQAWAAWADRIQPYLEGEVPRVDRLTRGSVGQNQELPFDVSPFPSNYERIFADPALESMIAERWFRIDRAMLTLARIEQLIGDILDMIDVELGR